MKYAPLGNTGLQVSCIGLGLATFGVAPQAAVAERMVGYAIDLGINLIDTANSYGNQSRFDRPGAPPADQRLTAEEILVSGAHISYSPMISAIVGPTTTRIS